MTEYEYRFIERVAIMTENGETEDRAIAEAIYEVRGDMVTDGMDFGKANLKVYGIKKGNYNG